MRQEGGKRKKKKEKAAPGASGKAEGKAKVRPAPRRLSAAACCLPTIVQSSSFASVLPSGVLGSTGSTPVEPAFPHAEICRGAARPAPWPRVAAWPNAPAPIAMPLLCCSIMIAMSC